MSDPLKNPGTQRPAAAAARRRQLVDTYARSISYLRISLTDHCNLRCLYCTPKEGHEKLPSRELLTYEEILRVAALAAELGIRKVRLTGGEPLMRRDVLSFIRRLGGLGKIEDIRLTTNGVLLPELAGQLYETGIRKLNISLDTLRPDRYREITGSDLFAHVWAGIQQVKQLGFAPIKINMVVLKGTNDDELLDFARLTWTEPFQIRFIELMPMGDDTAWTRDRYLSAAEIKGRLSRLGPLLPVAAGRLDGPASIFRYKDSVGSLGFISPISQHFCDQCNRLRLTAEGSLRSCLLFAGEIDLKRILRRGGSDEQIKEALVQAALNKPRGHLLADPGSRNCHGQMSRIGG